MYYINKLFLFLFILFFNNNNLLVNCQLTPITPITSLSIREFNNNQNYFSYPKYSNSNYCPLDIKLIVEDNSINRINSIIKVNSTSDLNFLFEKSENAISIFTLQLNDHLNSTKNDLNTTYTFQINAYSNYSVQVTYEIKFTCCYPDTSNASIDILNYNSGILRNGYSYQNIKVNGLNFNFSFLETPNSYNGQAWGYNIFLFAIYSDLPEYDFTFILWDRNITLKTINPAYVSEVSIVNDIVTYPNSLVNEIKQFGFGFLPLYTFRFNSTLDYPPFDPYSSSIPIQLEGHRGNMTYIYKLIDYNINSGVPTTNTFAYNNGTSMVNVDFVVDTSYLYPLTYPSLDINLGNPSIIEIPMVKISFVTKPNYYYVYRHFFPDFSPEILQKWPFGFVSGNNLNCTVQIAIQVYEFSPITVKNYKVYPVGASSPSLPNYFVPRYTEQDVSTIKKPQLISYEFINIIGTKNLVRIRVFDAVGLNRIQFGINLVDISIGESLVQGDIFNGTYEFAVDINMGIALVLTNSYDVSFQIDQGGYVSLNPIYQYLPPVQFTDIRIDSILDVTFLYDNFTIVDDEYHNIAYIKPNLDLLPSSQGVKFMIRDKNSIDTNTGFLSSWNTVWDEARGVYSAKFILPKGSMYGILQYAISVSRSTNVFSFFFPNSSQISVDSSYYYQSGPIFSNFERYPNSNVSIASAESLLVGWKVTIKDYYGFSKGYIKVIGSIDNSIYHFNFTLSNALNTTLFNSSKFESVYDIAINITSPCLSQDYIIEIVELKGITGITSLFKMYDVSPDPIKNPFRLFLEDSSINRINVLCSDPVPVDKSTPTLSSFTVSTNLIDVSSSNRLVSFNFTATDLETGLKNYQYPIVYLIGKRTEILECVSQIISITSISASYQCSVNLPYGFAFPGSIILSVYGFINNGGYYGGFTPFDLQSSGYQYYINTSLVSNSLYIKSNEAFFSDGGNLILYGNGFKKINSVTINYLEPSSSMSTTLTSNYSTMIVIKNVLATTKPFTVKFKDQFSVESNQYTVYPIYFTPREPEPTIKPTPTPSPTPTPTSPPPQCPGSPEPCGGSKKGYCGSDGNCVCFSPNVGPSCSSEVIIIPQPSTNTTDPTVEIPTNNGNGTGNNNIETIFFKSLISMVSLRELDYNGKQVKQYPFDKWIYTKINDSSNLYFTNITSTTNITVQLQWFTNETIINFAGFNLTMLPSSIKYTIEINEYQFTSTLNQLQLVMSASFSASKSNDICSNKDFGSNGDDNSNYLKMQIDDHSLYGRFIKRGVVDGDPKTINNVLLDSSLNTINQGDINDSNDSGSSVQSFIGITIPYYTKKIIIDPDFSVLIDSKTASDQSNNGNTICNRSKSGLTTAQLAGIIVGSVAFASVAIIIIAYAIYQHRRNRIFVSKIETKLKNVN